MTIAKERGARRCASIAEGELQHLERAVRIAHAQGFVVIPMKSDYWRDRLERFSDQFDLVSHQRQRVETLMEMLLNSAPELSNDSAALPARKRKNAIRRCRGA
jgi:hypothetical protein